jgi:hypothetical protein
MCLVFGNQYLCLALFHAFLFAFLFQEQSGTAGAQLSDSCTPAAPILRTIVFGSRRS